MKIVNITEKEPFQDTAVEWTGETDFDFHALNLHTMERYSTHGISSLVTSSGIRLWYGYGDHDNTFIRFGVPGWIGFGEYRIVFYPGESIWTEYHQIHDVVFDPDAPKPVGCTCGEGDDSTMHRLSCQIWQMILPNKLTR